jgi:hypothetical protein
MQKSSAYTFASGSSLQVASSVSTSHRVTGGAQGVGQARGVAKVTVDGVTLEANYDLEPEGLRVNIEAFDGADPTGTRLRDTLLLKANERRVVTVKRALGRLPAYFTITRIGGGVEILAERE